MDAHAIAKTHEAFCCHA